MPDPIFYRPSYSEFGFIDPEVEQRLVTVAASDGGRSRGVLYVPPGPRPRTVVVRTHPSGDLPQHWSAPYWTSGGFAFMSCLTRYVNNYTSCVHERIILDIAAMVRFLKHDMGFERVIFHGQSGGAACMTYYQAEATTPVGQRTSEPPGGGGPDLNDHELIPADGLILIAGHPGQGKFLLGAIDPSVIDESDPIAVDPHLDMYDSRNGWRPAPQPSKYDEGWLEEYRAAQESRVRRIDATARDAIAGRSFASSLVESPAFSSLDENVRRDLERRSQLERIMIVFRTEARPGYTDLTIDPSDREYGSIQGERPDLQNYTSTGFGKLVSAEGWLSTWSGVSAKATLERNLPKVSEPTLFVFPRGDQDIYPSAFQAQLKQAGSADVEHFWLQGVEHYLRPTKTRPYQGDIRADAMQQMIDWSRKRFEP